MLVLTTITTCAGVMNFVVLHSVHQTIGLHVKTELIATEDIVVVVIALCKKISGLEYLSFPFDTNTFHFFQKQHNSMNNMSQTRTLFDITIDKWQIVSPILIGSIFSMFEFVENIMKNVKQINPELGHLEIKALQRSKG